VNSVGRLVGISLAAVAALSCLGWLTSPRWRLTEASHVPQLPAVKPQPSVETQDRPAGDVVEEPTTIQVTGDRLDARIVRPARPGTYPAVVLVAGAGPSRYSDLLPVARDFAADGVIALCYDKRTHGYDAVLDRDFHTLAEDALAGTRLLRARPDVDSSRLGLWGMSEGAGWVVPIAASIDPGVRFAILASAPVTTPATEVSWSADQRMRLAGMPRGLRRAVVRALSLPGGPTYSHFDPTPYLATMRQPVLALYGLRDAALPPVQDAERLLGVLGDTGSRTVTVRFFDADHSLSAGGKPAPGVRETMSWWIRGLPATGTPTPQLAVAGSQPGPEPAMPQSSRAPVDLGPYGMLPLGTAALGLLGYLGCVVLRRIRHEPAGPTDAGVPVRRQLTRTLVLLVAMEGAFAGAIALGVVSAFTASDFRVPASLLWGLHKLAAFAAVPLAVSVGLRLVRARREGWRPTCLEVVQLTAGSVAAVSLLLEAAHWEHFAL
jgi:uncharacterized protein